MKLHNKKLTLALAISALVFSCEKLFSYDDGVLVDQSRDESVRVQRSKKTRNMQRKSKKDRKQKKGKETSGLICVKDAIAECQKYLQHLKVKYNITLSATEEKILNDKTMLLIHQEAGDSDPQAQLPSIKYHKIRKALKHYLKMVYPEKFVPRQMKTKQVELDLRMAKRSVRTTVKDYLINSCNITDPETVRSHWKSVKPLVMSELTLKSYTNDANELVVPKYIIGSVIHIAMDALKAKGLKPVDKPQTIKVKVPHTEAQQPATITPKKFQKRVDTPRRSRKTPPPVRSRKKDREVGIPLTKAHQIVQTEVIRTIQDRNQQNVIIKKIMKRIKEKTVKRGTVFPSMVKIITAEEIEKFKSVQKRFEKKGTQEDRSQSSKRSRSRLSRVVYKPLVEEE